MILIDSLWKNPLQYSTKNAAGFDIPSCQYCCIDPGEFKLVETGLFISPVNNFDLIKDYYIQINPRSGLTKQRIIVYVGTVDNDYTGEIKVNLENRSNDIFIINMGDRIAQGIVLKYYRAEGVRVKDYMRGNNGFGSTGR